MIALDPLTVLLFSALVVVVTSALFLADAWGPDLSLAERLWCTAFASSLLACVLLAPVELLPEAAPRWYYWPTASLSLLRARHGMACERMRVVGPCCR